MKYYDLVFLKLVLKNDTFHGSYLQLTLFRVFLKAPCVLSLVTVGYVFSSILLVVFLSFNTDDYFLASFIASAPCHTVGVPLPSAPFSLAYSCTCSYHSTLCFSLCVQMLL